MLLLWGKENDFIPVCALTGVHWTITPSVFKINTSFDFDLFVIRNDFFFAGPSSRRLPYY